MKIESASISLSSAHHFQERSSASISVQSWSNAALRPGPSEAVAPRSTPAAAHEASASELDMFDEADRPQISLLIAMIEHITGQKVRLFRMAQLDNSEAGLYSAPTPGANLTPDSPQQGRSVQLRTERVEHEQVGFAASGVVRTSDGQEIRFDLGFMMERSFAERISLDFQSGAPQRQLQDPLMLDFAGTGASLQDVRFAFDLDGDGTDEAIPLPMGGSGFLAFDRNNNGRIDDGRELFGPTTGQGFEELAALDSDGNGWIDSADAAFSQLRLWQPEPDGPGRLMTLAEAGVGALYLGNVATPFSLRDASNNTLGMMRASSVYIGTDGRVGTVSQIDLAV